MCAPPDGGPADGEAVRIGGQGVHRTSLYLSFNFAVNQKLL